MEATNRVGDGGFWRKNTKDAGFGGETIGWFMRFQGGKKGLGRLGFFSSGGNEEEERKYYSKFIFLTKHILSFLSLFFLF